MATRPPHSRPAHPHLAGLPSLHEEPAPASGTTPTPRARRSSLTRGSVRLQSVGSGGVASDPVENEAPRATKDDPRGRGVAAAAPTPREDLAAETTFVVLPWSPLPQPRPDIPSTIINELRSTPARRNEPDPRSSTAVPVAPSSTAKPVQTGSLAVSPDLDATRVGRVRLLEERPRVRLVEDNPPIADTARAPDSKRR